jgi:putative SOS response-associated peptidase YedK
MSFAGLWEGWRDPASGEVLRTFTILTTDANRYLAPLHNRMPVILDRDAWSAWLGDEAATPEGLRALLRPYPDEALIAWPVAPRVGNVREDDPGLIERLTGAPDLPHPAR